MPVDPLASVQSYSVWLAELLAQPAVERSTITVWSAGPYTGVAEGEAFFIAGYRLRMREEIDFADRLITAYGYEVYRGNKKLYWYDDFPHPHDPTLAATYPHHKHVPPDIKHNRIPAPGMSFMHPNLDLIVAEILSLIDVASDS